MTFAALPAIATALAILLVPGVLLRVVGRLGLLAALALGSAGTVAVIGVFGVVAGAAGIPFSPLVLVPIVLGAVVVGLLLRRRREVAEPARTTLGTVIALAVGAIVILLVVGEPILSPDRFAMNYDGVFHLNAVARILDTGDASSFTMYRVINPGDDVEYYPAAWHGIVALVCLLTGTSIPLATSAVWVATSIAIWLPGIGWLAATLAPQRRAAVAMAGIVLGSAFAAAPYGLLSWGTLYPTGLAYALMPAGLALLLRVVDIDSGLWSRRRLVSIAAFVVWLVVAGLAHPRSLITFAAIAVPVLFAVVIRLLARLGRQPGRRRLAIGLAVGGGVAVVVLGSIAAWVILRYFGAFGEPIADRLNGGPALATQTPIAAILQVVAQAPLVAPFETMLIPAFGLALLAIAGFVVAARRRELIWMPVAFVLLGALYVIAASSDADLAKILTGLWYKDKFRLLTALPVLAVPAAALGTVWLLGVLGRIRGSRLRVVAVALAALVVVGTAVPGLLGVRAAVHATFTIQPEKDFYALLDTAEYRLLQQLPELVPEGELVVGNPWNGSALTWAIGDRESVFPHLNGAWGADRKIVATSLDRAANDPEVCEALGRLNATYLFAAPGLLNGGHASVSYWEGVDRAPGTEGFTEVAREGDSVLYRITACD